MKEYQPSPEKPEPSPLDKILEEARQGEAAAIEKLQREIDEALSPLKPETSEDDN